MDPDPSNDQMREPMDDNTQQAVQDSMRMATDFSQCKVGYNPDLYVKKSNTSQLPQMSIDIMGTQKFMNQIDLRCDDHLIHFKEDVQATRYCSDCKTLCCDSCVIEFHNAHISAAKTKIEDYFRKQKHELEDLRAQINSSIKYKVNNAEINTIIDNHEKVLSSFFTRRQAHLEEQKMKINSIIEEEKEVCAKIKEAIQVFYREECFRRLDTPIKANTELLSRILAFLRDWDGYSKTDKVMALKNNQISIFKQESLENTEMIKTLTEAFKGKSRTAEKKIEEILKGFAFTEEMTQIDTGLSQMSEVILESKKKIAALKYNEIIEEKVENIYKAQPLPQPQQQQQQQLQNNDSLISDDFKLMKDDQIQRSNNFTFNQQNQFIAQPNTYTNLPLNQPRTGIFDKNNFVPQQNEQNNPYNIPQQPQQAQQPQPLQHPQEAYNQNEKKGYNYDLFIAIKPKSEKELIIYEPKNGFSNIIINETCFQDSLKAFSSFPEGSKYVNLGSSILLTGGYINKELSTSCFLLVVGKSQKVFNVKPYEVNIMPYGNMIEQRERHNIIFLPDKNKVMVCSGFFNSGSEITDINTGVWKTAGKMNDIRGNATIAYINNRYVYVFGGYKVIGKNNGIYHGDAEYFDVNSMSGWKQINFADNILKQSAMGVIGLGENYILLCGGFDGTQYKREVYKVDMSDIDSPKLSRINLVLPGNYIFVHNTFVSINDSMFNCEIGSSAVEFNPNTWTFAFTPLSLK